MTATAVTTRPPKKAVVRKRGQGWRGWESVHPADPPGRSGRPPEEEAPLEQRDLDRQELRPVEWWEHRGESVRNGCHATRLYTRYS